jgi:hypothetical protein
MPSKYSFGKGFFVTHERALKSRFSTQMTTTDEPEDTALKAVAFGFIPF